MKTRLDVLLTEQGYFPTREKAKAAIMAGLVFVDGQISDKPGTGIKDDAVISVKGDSCPFVGRGGLKLAGALEVFGVNPLGFRCIDIGASTGGFTDCLLQNGAEKVWAVDVGYGQLDYKLRVDPRVVNIEKQNFRYMTPDQVGEPLDLAVTDVSFISLKHIFPNASAMLKDGGLMIALIKPQFEAGREQVGSKGIVKDLKVQKDVIEKVMGFASESRFTVTNLSYSPVKGAKGNIEFLLMLRKCAEGEKPSIDPGIDIEKIVELAHSELDNR
ncbi:MAG: TlyA family RNA methyltransferase [Firmicutes bacterium]|nr:TlyA family RNA methyltransferase [Bacillota bacterium]